MRKVSLFLIVTALIVAASFTQPAAFGPEQDKAAEVLADVRKALGGGKLDSLKTFSMEAKTARNVGTRQMVSDVELYLEIPDKYLRVENITAPMAASISSGFNGDKIIRPSGGPAGGGAPMMIMNGAPMHGGGGGAVTTMVVTRGGGEMAAGGRTGGAAPTPEQQVTIDASMLRGQRVELSRYMLGWFGMAHPGLKATYSYVGEAESPDGKAHVIGIKADGGFDSKLFVDQATNIPLMLTYQGAEPRVINTRVGAPAAGAPAGPAAPPKMVEYRIFFTDWKEVDGIQFPHMLQRAVAGTTTEEWTIAKVKVNPRIDARKFATQ